VAPVARLVALVLHASHPLVSCGGYTHRDVHQCTSVLYNRIMKHVALLGALCIPWSCDVHWSCLSVHHHDQVMYTSVHQYYITEVQYMSPCQLPFAYHGHGDVHWSCLSVHQFYTTEVQYMSPTITVPSRGYYYHHLLPYYCIKKMAVLERSDLLKFHQYFKFLRS
jgi:hypothetical protein